MIPGFKIIDDILKGLPENAHLRSQLGELRPQIETLQRELTDARMEIQRLKNKYESSPDDGIEILKVLATKDDFWTPQQVSDATGIDVVRVQNLLAKLKLDNYASQSIRSYRITNEGRAALL